MKITIFAKTSAREEKVERLAEGEYRVSVKEAPQDGRANRAIERIIADHFDIAPSRVSITSGQSAKRKIAEII